MFQTRADYGGKICVDMNILSKGGNHPPTLRIGATGLTKTIPQHTLYVIITIY